MSDRTMAAQVFETTSLPVQICLAGLVVAAAVLLRLAFPEKTAGHDYASQKYWDGRYRHVPEDKHEWWEGSRRRRCCRRRRTLRLCRSLPPATPTRRYVDVDDALLRRIVAAISAPGKPKVLDIGCGNSTLVQRLSTARWDVTGIDYSPAVINRMQSIHPDYAHKYVVGDCSSMRFKTASFDAAIDKGTIDGILQHADKDPRAKRNARRVRIPMSLCAGRAAPRSAPARPTHLAPSIGFARGGSCPEAVGDACEHLDQLAGKDQGRALRGGERIRGLGRGRGGDVGPAEPEQRHADRCVHAQAQKAQSQQLATAKLVTKRAPGAQHRSLMI